MSESQRIAKEVNTIIIGGRTGSGKTLLLEELQNSIDLEALANHRGSSFGHYTTPQPTQIEFENALAYALIQHEAQEHASLIIEHESRNIGYVNIPKGIFEPLQKNASLIILQTPIATRVDITFDEYVTEALVHYHDKFGQEGEKRWFDDVSAGLARIQKRLGSERYLEIKKVFEQSYHDKNLVGHKVWIEILLSQYYDPMYDYQIEKSPIPIIFRGDANEVKAYLAKEEKI
jgi:tRNA 2-selenouridine synthase